MSVATVLIVDDDRVIVRLCQRLLERASYHVIIAMDPLEALRVLESNKVDLLVSDIRMPIMDGFELVGRAKKLQPELPVLVMTGYGSVEYAIQALHRGVEGLILKPFESSAELVQTVQRVLEESRQRRDAARLQALRPLFDVTEQLLAETSPQPLEKLILSAVVGVFQAGYAGIYRLNAHNNTLEHIRSTDSQPVALEIINQDTLLVNLLANGTPVIINTTGPSTSAHIQQMLVDAGVEGTMFASVQRNASQFIFCACREKGAASFTEADLEMFVILARQAAVAMENARLYSELRAYVRQVEESQRALVQAEKMAAVGRLMASMSHEINNPLQSVRNCLHLASRNALDPERRLHYLDLTENELERLVTTVRRMLDFYRPGALEKAPTRIEETIDRVVQILTPQLNEQGVKVITRFVGKPRQVELVVDQFQQVIFNLMLNAMDALDEKSPLSGQDEKIIWIDVFYEVDQLRVLIEDSGPGVSQELRERVFEPFISTKQQGTGLGLSVSYDIMEKHQGRLSIVTPRHGSGACFEVTLPFGANTLDG